MHEQSNEIGEMAKALAGAQAAMSAVKKDRTAKIPTKAGGSYSYSYADLTSVLDACREVLPKHGLAISQTTKSEGQMVVIYTTLMHSSGQWIRGCLSLAAPGGDPKAVGSAITYARRYGLSAIVGLSSEDDDDGQAASRPPKSNKEHQRQRPHPVDAPAYQPPVEVRTFEDAVRVCPAIHARTPLEPDDFGSKPEWRGIPISEAYGWQDAAIDLAKSRGFKNLNDNERAFALWAKDLKAKREAKKGAAA